MNKKKLSKGQIVKDLVTFTKDLFVLIVKNVNFRAAILLVLKTKVVELSLGKLLQWGLVSVGGFRMWLAKFLVKYGYDKLLAPGADWLIRRGLIYKDKVNGRIKVKRLNDAIEDGDLDKWLSTINKL